MTKTLLMSRPTRNKTIRIAKMKVVGVGDVGCSIINRMMCKGLIGVDFIAMNTDAPALALSEAPTRILLGEKLAGGLGIGNKPKLAFKAAEESRHAIEEAVAGADIVLIIAGMGGGTGTGGIPIVAEVAKESGILTIALVTEPFSFEGEYRLKVAEEGIQKLSDKVDTLIIIRNDRLLELSNVKMSADHAFEIASETLFQVTRAICEITTTRGLINLDLADINVVMKDAGLALASIGRGSGQDRAIETAKAALTSPLIDVPINEAKGILLNITGGSSLTLFECNEAAQIISQAVDPRANIIFGVVFDTEMNDEINVTIIATGFGNQHGKEPLGVSELVTEIIRFQKARAFFEANRQELLAKYEGKHIAILNGKVVGADDDFSTLAEGVYNRYGYKDIYMPKIKKERTILHIPTPQIKRK
jgi:cell division protein FtsZ